MRRATIYHRSALDETVAVEILRMRRSSDYITSEYLRQPETLIYLFIERTNGNVRLRLITVACELGVTMRTLERRFARRFAVSMAEHQALAPDEKGFYEEG